MSILNVRIKQRREALGMSQAELAELLGYSDRSTIAKIEKGTNDITQSKIEAFAKVLHTTPAYLMGWESDSGEQDLGLTALDVAKWLDTDPEVVEAVMEDMGWPDATNPEILSKISAEIERRKIVKKYPFGNKQIFAKNLKRYMDRAGIDRNKLCADLGIDYATICDWLSANKYPSIDKIEMIANHFGVSMPDLIQDPDSLAVGESFWNGQLTVAGVHAKGDGGFSVDFEVDGTGLSTKELETVLNKLNSMAKETNMPINYFSEVIDLFQKMAMGVAHVPAMRSTESASDVSTPQEDRNSLTAGSLKTLLEDE